MKKGTSKPIVVYPNSGELYDPEEKVWCGDTSLHTFGESSHQWYKDSAHIIGGCCQTSAEDTGHLKTNHIIAQRINTHTSKKKGGKTWNKQK
ncbi:homocysteine S-methyltransferase family protein, partial [Bacillus pumilus]